MAISAITMCAGQFGCIAESIILQVMLMRVMAEVRCVRLFVLTIRCSDSPGGLQRQRDQQEDEEQFFHGVNVSIDFRIEIALRINASRAAITAVR